MVGRDIFGSLQVANGVGDFEDARICVAVGAERPRVSQPAVI